MTGTIIDGKQVATQIREDIKEEVSKLWQTQGLKPGLAVILVGEDPASQVYVRNKEKACHDVGIYSRFIACRNRHLKRSCCSLSQVSRTTKRDSRHTGAASAAEAY